MNKEKNLLTQLSELINEHNDLLDLYDAVEYYLDYSPRNDWEEKAALERLEYRMKRIKEKKNE